MTARVRCGNVHGSRRLIALLALVVMSVGFSPAGPRSSASVVGGAKGRTPTTIAAATAPADTCDWSGQSYEDFYVPPADLGELTPERLGEILRVEHVYTYTPEEIAALAEVPSSDYGALLYRILYLSQTPLLEAPISPYVVVSGFIVVPMGENPPGGGELPVVAWAHPTTGMADNCAPTTHDPASPPNDPVMNQVIEATVAWVANGYLVSATDYAGLGVPGAMHPFMVGDSAGYSVLDAGRAALRFCDEANGLTAPPAANEVFLAGHSQGGHAVLFADQLVEDYLPGAPELNVLGVVAFAPAAEPKILLENIVAGGALLNPLAPAVMAMYGYGYHYGDAPGDLPGDPPDLAPWLNEPYASEVQGKVETTCILGLTGWLFVPPEAVFQQWVLDAVDQGLWEQLEPFNSYLDLNTPADLGSTVPVLVLHGETDRDVPIEASERLVQRLCEEGTTAKLSTYVRVGHLGIVKKARPEASAWMEDRLAGITAPDSCQVENIVRSYLPLSLRSAP